MGKKSGGNPSNNQMRKSLKNNKWSYMQYYNRLTEIAISSFEYENMPDTIDTRFLELALFGDGQAVFFKDEVMGYLALQVMIGGELSVYRIPINRTAYATNGYQAKLNDKDSVIIWNNLIHTNSMLDVEIFAKRLYNIDRIIDVNVNAQKTPVLVTASEQQRLTMLNLYKNWDGNEPFIFGDKWLDSNSLKVLKTDAPYLGRDLYELKTEIWNEALTYLGISNVNILKRERLNQEEVTRNLGGVVACRFSRLQARQQAMDEINKMFGLNIKVKFKQDYMDINEYEENDKYRDLTEGEGNNE